MMTIDKTKPYKLSCLRYYLKTQQQDTFVSIINEHGVLKTCAILNRKSCGSSRIIGLIKVFVMMLHMENMNPKALFRILLNKKMDEKTD